MEGEVWRVEKGEGRDMRGGMEIYERDSCIHNAEGRHKYTQCILQHHPCPSRSQGGMTYLCAPSCHQVSQ